MDHGLLSPSASRHLDLSSTVLFLPKSPNMMQVSSQLFYA